MITRAFIDCEFTDLIDMELISIGLATESGEVFYAEIPYQISICGDFVKLAVLPLLDRVPGAQCSSIKELRDRLEMWLNQFERVCICYDYFGDFALFMEIFSNEIKSSITCANVRDRINQLKREEFFQGEGKDMRHHALFDARANCYAYEGRSC